MATWSLASAVSPNVTRHDVIALNNLQSQPTDRNIIHTDDENKTEVPSTMEQQQQKQIETTSVRPTTPVPKRNLNSKRPPHLTLRVKPTLRITPTVRSIETTENATLSSISSSTSTSAYATPLVATPGGTLDPNNSNSNSSSSSSSTTGSTFPHEHYKAIKKIDIGFENVKYSTKIGIFKRENKDILVGVTGKFRSGELTAIVGPSGAGKSTLLNIISGYTSFGYSGEFFVNGKSRDLKTFKPNVAFIRQDNSLQAFLSVKEAMHFAANLKIGSHMTVMEKKERVRSILEAIGMYETRNTRTGNLSGGQKKRLAIALELVNNPPVLILDEPTTGLDSSTSNQLISLLKKLAQEGRTVICTIHQPSALLFAMFDHLYAIAEGHCIYAGGTQNLVPCLDALGMRCPESYNPADYLMEIATHDYDTEDDLQLAKLIALMDNGRCDDYRQNKSSREAQKLALQKIDQMMASGLITPVTAPVLTTPLLSNSNNYEQQQQTSQQYRNTFKPMTPINELSSRIWDSKGSCLNDTTTNGINSKQQQQQVVKNKTKSAIQLDAGRLCKRENIYATPFYRQLGILLVRTFLLIWRDHSLTTLRFAIHIITGLLIGIIYYGIGNDAGNALNNFRFCFYSNMFIMFSAFSGILTKFPLEFPIVSREHFNRWYSLRAYYVAITLADIPIQIICTSLYLVPTYLMTNQPLEFTRFLLFFGIIFMTALVAQSIGLAVGAALSIELGAIIGPFFICPFLQFSGFFLARKDAPVYLRWLFDVSFLRYSLDGSVLAIFGYDRAKFECKDMYCHYNYPKFLLKDLDLLRANYEFSMIFMFVLFVLMRILAFYIMSFRLRLFR